MADIDENEQSEVVRITGGDEQFAADVIESTDTSRNSICVDVQNQIDVKGTVVAGSGLKTVQITSNTSIPSGASWFDVLNVTGAGVFYGGKINFSNESVEIRLVVDGVQAFILDFDFIDDLNLEPFSDAGVPRWLGKGSFGELEFFPTQNITYTTDLSFQVRKTVGFNIDIERALIFYV